MDACDGAQICLMGGRGGRGNFHHFSTDYLIIAPASLECIKPRRQKILQKIKQHLSVIASTIATTTTATLRYYRTDLCI